MELNESLRAVVAVLAEAHERAEPEFVGVAAMWLDVITDCRRRDDAALRAVRTERVHRPTVRENAARTSASVTSALALLGPGAIINGIFVCG